MSNISYENYGFLAKQNISYTEIAGRHIFQKTEEKNILYDIIKKMELRSDDDILEIGCGTGSLLIPLSFFVNSATGVDHPDVIAAFKARFNDKSINLISGNFLKTDLRRKYSKILIYSVIHYLSDEQEIFEFIEKALSNLKSGGSLLIGDIPNGDKRKRFGMTVFGQKIQNAHNQKIQVMQSINKSNGNPPLVSDEKIVTIDDNLILKLLLYFREQNFETYLVPQNLDLPFCYTRDDIIVKRPKK